MSSMPTTDTITSSAGVQTTSGTGTTRGVPTGSPTGAANLVRGQDAPLLASAPSALVGRVHRHGPHRRTPRRTPIRRLDGPYPPGRTREAGPRRPASSPSSSASRVGASPDLRHDLLRSLSRSAALPPWIATRPSSPSPVRLPRARPRSRAHSPKTWDARPSFAPRPLQPSPNASQTGLRSTAIAPPTVHEVLFGDLKAPFSSNQGALTANTADAAPRPANLGA